MKRVPQYRENCAVSRQLTPVFHRVNFKSPFCAKCPGAIWLRTDQLFHAAVHRHEVIDHVVVSGAIDDAAMRTNGFSSMRLHVGQKM